MKKTLILLAAIFALQLYAKSQTEIPVITELHVLLQSAKNNFADNVGKKIDEDTASKIIYYDAKTPAVAAEAFVIKFASGQNAYVLNYDMKGDNLLKFAPLVEAYINELNVMAKSGNYTGEDYKNKSGKGVTDMRDKSGKLVLRYTSDTETQTIFLYGFVDGK